jgi:RNA-dependent RNA polymerase
MKLARLHSDAVDFPKSGQPVMISKIPKLLSQKKPDWNSPETVSPGSEKYYPSQRAIGKLFREIDLPALETVKQTRRQHLMEDDEESLEERLLDLAINKDALYLKVEQYVQDLGIDIDADVSEEIHDIFNRYASELRNICASHTLSHYKSAMLTEEEAIVGTIVAKSSQPRYRRKVIASLRERTDHLVRILRQELGGDDDLSDEEQLSLAWVAWKLSIRTRGRFGTKSFGWLALGQMFEKINAIKEAVDAQPTF